MESCELKPSPIYPLRTFTTEELTREHGSFISKKVWRIAYSPDEKLFAWTAGDFWVTIVLQTYSITAHDRCDGGRKVESPLVIHCQYPITSISLGAACEGCRPDGSGNCREQSFWRRFNGSSVAPSVLLASGHNNGRIRIWDAYTGKILLELLDNSIGAVVDLSFEPPSSQHGLGMTLASIGDDCRLRLWNLHEDGHIASHCALLDGGARVRLRMITWSPDGRWLGVVGGHKTAVLVSSVSCSVVHRLVGHNNDVSSCSFSPDSALILTASYDTKVILWDCLTGQQLKSYLHMRPEPSLIFASGFNGSWIRDVSFSADRKHFTTVSDDGFLRVWNVDNTEKPQYSAQLSEPLCCRFTPSGRAFVVGTNSGKVSVFVASGRVRSLQFECRLALQDWMRSKPEKLLQNLRIPESVRHYLACEHIIDDI